MYFLQALITNQIDLDKFDPSNYNRRRVRREQNYQSRDTTRQSLRLFSLLYLDIYLLAVLRKLSTSSALG